MGDNSAMSPAESLLSTQDLFEAGTQGYYSYRIPGLLVTGSGAVLATVEARRGSGGDWDTNDLVLRRSIDGGRTWEPCAVLVYAEQYGAGPVSNCVLIEDGQAAVHLLYCWNYARVFHRVSTDDGATFGPPREITAVLEGFRPAYPWRVIATGPGHATRLRSGRLIVPLWMSTGAGPEFGPGKLGHRPSCVSLIYSDNHGQMWQRGAIVIRQEDAVNPSETACVELSDGHVYFNVRSESEHYRRLVTVSPDGIGQWSTPLFDEDLLEPVCMASLIRHSWPTPDTPGIVLFANPDNLEQEFPSCGPGRDRKRLTVKASLDNCRTWPVARVLEPGRSGYSDLGVLPAGDVLCLYERAAPDRPAAWSLRLARFDIAWLIGDDNGRAT